MKIVACRVQPTLNRMPDTSWPLHYGWQ